MAGILYLLHVFRNTYSACRSFSILGVQNEADLDRTLGGKNRSGSFIIDRKQGLVTGSNHGWKQRLCRVQNSLPSVKNRALGKDLLCRVPHSAKNYTRQRVLCRVPDTRQKKALGKGLLCRVPDSRQKRNTWHRLPRVTVFGHILLCRVPGVRHSAKIFFGKYFAECP